MEATGEEWLGLCPIFASYIPFINHFLTTKLVIAKESDLIIRNWFFLNYLFDNLGLFIYKSMKKSYINLK
jgi:hypothetical protein